MGSRRAARGGALGGPVALAPVLHPSRHGPTCRFATAGRPRGAATVAARVREPPRAARAPGEPHSPMGTGSRSASRALRQVDGDKMPSPGRLPPGKPPQQLGRRFGIGPRCLPRRPAGTYPNAHQATTEQHGCSLVNSRVETAPADGEDTEAPPLRGIRPASVTCSDTCTNSEARAEPSRNSDEASDPARAVDPGHTRGALHG